jgi:hypothetical protein
MLVAFNETTALSAKVMESTCLVERCRWLIDWWTSPSRNSDEFQNRRTQRPTSRPCIRALREAHLGRRDAKSHSGDMHLNGDFASGNCHSQEFKDEESAERS